MLYPELPGIGENIFLLTGNGTGDEGAGTGPEGTSPTGDHLTTGMELVALWAEEAQRVNFGKPRWNNGERANRS